MNDETTHLPPQSLEAEEATLGAMLMSAQPRAVADDLHLEGRHFYRPSHRTILEAIRSVERSSSEVDELTVITQLKTMGKLGEIGGAAAIMSLIECVPSLANARSYIQEVVEVATKRALVERGHAIAKLGYDTTVPADAGVQQAEHQLLELVTSTGKRHQRGEAVDTEQSMEAWAARYARRSDDELLEQDTLSWGRPELDERLGRMRPGQVFVPAGWTKHGKTWFVLDVAEAVMNAGHRVLVDSGEMTDEELNDRWMAMGGHNYTAIEEGRIPWGVLADRRKQMQRWQRRVLTGRMTMARLRSQVSRAKLERRPYRLVIVDHLGLLRPVGAEGRNGRREFVEDAVAELKAMAEEYEFTLLLVSQLSRPPAEKEAHPRYLRPPIQSDLKEASGIEQIATAVVFVYRQMERKTGRFDGQKAALLIPFHRSKQPPDPVTCEFVLPSRPAGASQSAYRFIPVTVQTSEPTPEAAAVQEQLEGSFGPVSVVTPDDIPF